MLQKIDFMRPDPQAEALSASVPELEVSARRYPRLCIAVLGACVILGSLLLHGCDTGQKPQGGGPMPVHVEAVAVKVTNLDQELNAVGSLSSPQETMVAPQISGRVVALNIAQGQVLQRDAVLARLDDSIQKAAVAAAAAALANAQQIYARDRQVINTGGVSEQQLQSDQAAVRQAAAQLQQARVNLQYTTIRAPFTGSLGMRQVSLGAYLKAGDAIVQIRQLDPLYLDFELPQQDVARLGLKQPVVFSVAGLSGEFKGTVTTIDQALDANSRSVHVQATVANPKLLLKPGMFVNVRLVVGTKPDTLFVPAQAIVPEGQVRHVWVVGPQDQAQERTVEVGVYQNNWVEIVSGLKPAERVVTAGVQKLYPGAKLVVSPYQPIHNQRLDLAGPQE